MRQILILLLALLIGCSGADPSIDDVSQDTMPGLIVISNPTSPTKVDMGENVRITKRAIDGYNLVDYDNLYNCYCQWAYVDGKEYCLPMYQLPTDIGLFVDNTCSHPLFRGVEPTTRGVEYCGRFYGQDGKLKIYKWTRTEFRNYWFFLKKEDQYGWKKTCTGAAPFGEWSGKENTILDPVELSLSNLASK